MEVNIVAIPCDFRTDDRVLRPQKYQACLRTVSMWRYAHHRLIDLTFPSRSVFWRIIPRSITFQDGVAGARSDGPVSSVILGWPGAISGWWVFGNEEGHGVFGMGIWSLKRALWMELRQ